MQLIEELFNIGAIQFGEYALKSGVTSPVYIDLRVCISYPGLMIKLASAIYEKTKQISFDLVCGVPYAGICFASAFSFHTKSPMILTRKERKKYGSKKIIEGKYRQNDTCLIIEDITTTGSSLTEVVQILKQENLKVLNAISIIDRNQRAEHHLLKEGCTLTSLYSLNTIVKYLFDLKKIGSDQFETLMQFSQKNSV